MSAVKYCAIYGNNWIFEEFTVSRVGKMPIPIPAGVTINFKGTKFTAKGPKGELTIDVSPDVKFETKGEQIIVVTKSNSTTEK